MIQFEENKRRLEQQQRVLDANAAKIREEMRVLEANQPV